jgi:hypothetical protein
MTGGRKEMRTIVAALVLSAAVSACYLSSKMEFREGTDGGEDARHDTPADQGHEGEADIGDLPAEDLQDAPEDLTEDPSPPQYCAGDMNCPDGYYCELFSCGIPGGTFGVCLQVPLGCTTECVSLVCGCDGNTYCNDCDRRMQRVSLGYVGACIETVSCSSSDPNGCPAGTFCDTSRGPDSGCATGIMGVCRPVPGWCPDDIPLAVCGCDGVTYPGDCFRMMASTSRDYAGTCGEY